MATQVNMDPVNNNMEEAKFKLQTREVVEASQVAGVPELNSGDL